MSEVPNEDFLRESEKLWKARHTKAQAEYEQARGRESHWYWHWRALSEHRDDNDAHRKAAWHDYDQARQVREEAEAQRDAASEMLRLRRAQLEHHGSAIDAPRIITPKEAGLIISRANFGGLGPETKVTTHYAASARARNLDQGMRLAQSFDRYHRSKGWRSLSYHYLIPDSGELILGRSVYHKGAHVRNTNYGNIGINFFCTLGHHPTEAQAQTYLWLLAHAHTDALPKTHRTELDLRKATIRGHNQWAGQRTDCPGHFTPANLKRMGT